MNLAWLIRSVPFLRSMFPDLALDPTTRSMIKSLPDDGDGNALRRLLRDGSDFSKPHEIDFHIAVKTKEAGQAIGPLAAEEGFHAKLVKDDEGPDWTLWCTIDMRPDYDEIVRISDRLNELARPHGGSLDGWGTFTVK